MIPFVHPENTLKVDAGSTSSVLTLLCTVVA